MSALASTIQNYIYNPDKFAKPKKNFIKENMKLIKKMQVEPKEKIDRRGAFSRPKEAKSLSNVLASYEKITGNLGKTPTAGKITNSKEQGCQTSTDGLDGGQIKFAKDKVRTPPPPDGKKNMSLQVDPITDLVYNTQDTSFLAPSHLPVKEDGKVDFVKLNMLKPLKKKPPAEKPDPIKAPPTYQRGVVPKYLREAKKHQLEEVQEKGLVEVIDELDQTCYALVGEEEKRERLREIRLAYASLVTELNSLPLRSDSNRIKEKRRHIESTLHKLEDGIKLFSREKLYLKV